MRQSILQRLPPIVALVASAAFASAAWAAPADEGREAAASSGAACDPSRSTDNRPDCPDESGAIDHLPDSFFVGGGGVGPRVVEAGGQQQVWVHAAGGASASAGAYAQASASATVRVSVSAYAHRRW